MSRPDDPDQTALAHDGACHDHCTHFLAVLHGLMREVTEPEMIITVNRLGFVEYASMLAPSQGADVLRALADAVERRAARRVSTYLN